MNFRHAQFLTALTDCDVPAEHALQIMGNLLTQEEQEAVSRVKLREEKRRKAALNDVADRLNRDHPYPEVSHRSVPTANGFLSDPRD